MVKVNYNFTMASNSVKEQVAVKTSNSTSANVETHKTKDSPIKIRIVVNENDQKEKSDEQTVSKVTMDSANKIAKSKTVNLSDSDTQSEKKNNTVNTSKSSFKSNFIYSKVNSSGKEKFIGLKITNINDLKKATPRLKFPAILSSTVKKPPAVSDEIKLKLDKYCRTCAGLKVPLVDIFSDKGVQMRLGQQIQHLEDIDRHDSLSTQMCMDCICDMRMSYKFFMQIKKAEMKLKSICNVLSTQSITIKEENESKLDSDEDFLKESIDVDSDNNKDKSYESDDNDNDFSTRNDTYDEIEEFDPDISNEVPQKEEIKTPTNEVKIQKPVYKFDETLNAYVKINNPIELQTIDKDQMNNKECNKSKVKATSSGLKNQLIKTPNILKRKASNGNLSDENIDKSNKQDVQKRNLGLKDIKIPKLNLEDAANIKTEEDGIMYVTAKGSKPNEMLLIKIKKMDKLVEKKGDKSTDKKGDKLMDKKGDKSIEKRKKDTMVIHKIIPHHVNTNKVDNKIDAQIEEYKKKRVQILGETANVSDITDNEEPEIRIVSKSINEMKNNDENNDENNETVEIKEEKDDDIDVIKNIPSQNASRLERMREEWKDIKKGHDSNDKDYNEDIINRLKMVLKQKDEYIDEFVDYLKSRKIIASGLKDDAIIALYEAKNNVVIDREQESTEERDPFEITESYDCDFCDNSFPYREMEFEHAKIHDFKLMHYCEDCKQEFPTHKSKRTHNITCVQKLMCKYCDMILESKGKKRQHEQKHCDEQYGQLCDLCGEKFKHQGTLDQHIKSRHMQLEKIFKCPQCPKKFAFRTKLTFHLKSVHTNARAYLCEECGSDFKNPASLRHHRIRKHQKVNNKKECVVCKKLIPVYSMSKHMHTHKSYSIACQHCDKMFKNTSTLKQHLRIHEDQRQYKCNMCGVGFNRRDGLRLHLKVHEKTDSRGLKECSCQVCGEKFPNHSMLVIHRNRTHKDGRNYTCYICNRSMISPRSLEWHLSNIHNETMPGVMKDESSVDVETKRVVCMHCDKTFKTEMILRTHIKNTHVEKEPMKCLDCDEMFTSDVRLKHHMMTQHGRLEGTLVCPHCPKRFVNQLRLKTHMISHSDERPHTCDLCGFMLKTKIQLIKHKQNRHSNERPLQCKYCSWRCKQVSALVCHERTHTNERPYSCSVCKQKFKYLGDKNKHERRHEVLGGTGFKRIVTGRNTNKIIKKKEDDLTEHDSEIENEGYEHGDEEYENHMEEYEEAHIVKFETADGSEASYDQVYIEDTSQDTSDATKVTVLGVDETTVYTEEVTTDNVEHTEIITNDMIDEHVLQAGTVVHLQQEDEEGKIQVIPVMLSLPDLNDGTTEHNLADASITYVDE